MRGRRGSWCGSGWWAIAVLAAAAPLVAQSDFHDGSADLNTRPEVPAGFGVTVFAREPLVRQTCSMAFDARGRLVVGMGPQYRNPTPETPGDSVVLVLDTDGDGTAETTKVFATGFNSIQGLAWRGRDLWVANAPDLTVVRDLDGDDTADEYVKVFTDLGNLEHGLHGLNWAPDGRLYMSKGNSKGLNLPDRYAPKAFRDLWGVPTPPGALDAPPAQTFTPDSYRRAYHDPADDWGREGGILRCEEGGKNLEIVARGFRNPWDIGFDDGFNWLGTDNDQNEGDRVFAPFRGAHFGWNHPWAAGWSGVDEPHLAPVCGPLFQGSGTGVVFGNSPQFPDRYRGVWFINDWLRKTTFVFRPHWDGATLGSEGGTWEPFVTGGASLFRPVDLEFGPDGALWCLGWSRGYGAEYANGEMTNEGRIYRIAWNDAPAAQVTPITRGKAPADCTVAELLDDFDSPLPVWRTNAQEELLRRGPAVREQLVAALRGGRLSRSQETWAAWTLGRLAPGDATIETHFATLLSDPGAGLNAKVQAVRLLAYRATTSQPAGILPVVVTSLLDNDEPRLRLEAVLALAAAGQRQGAPDLLARLASETDRTVFYAAWRALRELAPPADLRPLLDHPAGGVRAAALLALLDDHSLRRDQVAPLAQDTDPRVRGIAGHWLAKTSDGPAAPVVRGRALGISADAGPPDAEPAATDVPAGVVRGIQAASGSRHELAPGALRPGARHFTDRPFRLKSIPPDLEGCDLIRTANEDDGSSGDRFLTFEALLPVRVHVGIDTRTRAVPSWLAGGWSAGATVDADHWTYQLYSREFPAGPVALGGNTADGRAGGQSQYLVALETLPLPPPAQPTRVEEVLALLPKADPERGAALFHQRGAAGCAACHRLDGHGNVFGPDLAGIGTRADARHIVQSLLDPSAVITEGFNLTLIESKAGSFSGVLLEESGLAVTLGLATGQRQVIPKAGIVTRQSAPVSAMPAYAAVLSASHAADLAAFLLRHAPDADPDGSTPAPPTPRGTPDGAARSAPADWPAGDGFQVSRQSDRLVIAHDGQPVAHFVFRDPRILRPYFAHAHAPGGIQVTRRHPPVDGQDATDHADMHPGLWLGFGDLSGHDFWRNKAVIEHERFSEEPTVRDGRLHFATVSRLLDPGRGTLGRMTSRVTLSTVSNAHLITWEATIQAEESALVFGDQEEMGFGARVATALTETNGGRITSSAGATTAQATWGQAADWCDYAGIIDDRSCGITLMAAPSNFRRSWWHNRDYGVFVANPFGRAAMKQGEPSAVTVPAGQSLTLTFGAALHARPNTEPATPASFYDAFLKATAATPTKQPNIVWIVVDDMSPHLSCYGEKAIATPHLDRLAREGTRFTRAYVTAPVCSPCRSALITGCYQTTLGAHHHRSGRGVEKIRLPEGVVPVPALLRRAGYFTCIGDGLAPSSAASPTSPPPRPRLGKTDYNFEWSPAMYDADDWARRAPGQPFFMQVQLPGGKLRGGTDQSAVALSARAARELGSATDPATVTLPPYYPRDPVLLRDWAAYLDSVRLTDAHVGRLLARLETEGMLNDTLIVFLTDNGISHARGKQFLYDEGTHIPLIVRGPGVPAGAMRDDLVEHIDLAALTVAAAGLPLPPAMQAQNILAPDYRPRDAVFAARDRCDETVDQLRSVRTDQFLYIRNAHPQRPILQPNAYKDGKSIVQTLRSLHAIGTLDPIANRLLFSPTRPAEELYAYRSDRWQLTNLADDPAHQETLASLRNRLDQWRAESRDPGPESAAQYDSDMAVYLKEAPAIADLLRQNIALMKRWAAEGK